MAKEKLGVALFVGLIGLTAIVASGKFVDANSWLASLRGQPSGEAVENTAEVQSENQEQATTKAASSPETSENSQPAETDIKETAEGASEEQMTSEVKAASEETMTEQAKVGESAEEGVVSAQSDTTEVAAASNETSEPASVAADALEDIIMPTFDILRVEPDGSLLIAGIAAPLSEIEIVAGSNTLAKTTGNARGEFVAVLDDPLDQGDYEIVLRATAPDGSAVTSAETAIVSIPEAGSNEVLALVEAPGAPSRLITQPSAGTALVAVEPEGETGQRADTAVNNAEATNDGNANEVEIAKIEEQPKVDAAAAPAEILVRIEAVEIDGPTVFVAGAAKPGSRLRVYANDILLGDTIASSDGRFLVEVKRELPIGDYVIRADALGSNGVDVITRAAVPFTRAVGERLAAVAVPATSTEAEPSPVATDAKEVMAEQKTENSPISAEEKTASVAADAQTEEKSEAMTKSSETKKATGGAATDIASETPAIAVTAGEAKIASGDDNVIANGNQNEVLAAVSDSVIIRRGDTLWHISRRVYGRGVKYTTIYQANQDQIKDPNMIWPGQVFELPENREGLDN